MGFILPETFPGKDCNFVLIIGKMENVLCQYNKVSYMWMGQFMILQLSQVFQACNQQGAENFPG